MNAPREIQLETALIAAMRAIEIYATTPADRAFTPEQWSELTRATDLAREVLRHAD